MKHFAYVDECLISELTNIIPELREVTSFSKHMWQIEQQLISIKMILYAANTINARLPEKRMIYIIKHDGNRNSMQ